MIILFYGNCQLGVMDWMLTQMNVGLDLRTHFSYTNEEPPEKLYEDLSVCDIFIYHPVVNHKNTKLNTAALCQHLRPSCAQLRIQNLYFTPYFPNTKNIGAFAVNQYMYQRMRQLTTQTVEPNLQPPDGELLVSSWLKHEEQRARDRAFDVTMTDWILANYRHEKLFFTYQHCSTSVYVELLSRIFHKLENRLDILNCKSFSELRPKLAALHSVQLGDEWPIMEEVKLALELQFDCDCAHIQHKFMLRDDYVRLALKNTTLA